MEIDGEIQYLDYTKWIVADFPIYAIIKPSFYNSFKVEFDVWFPSLNEFSLSYSCKE